jgi:hypothetical protein
VGKRSNFARVERDFYPTPAEAVLPLLPHLPQRSGFVEPCAGDGALIKHLIAAGHVCLAAYDIEPQSPRVEQADAFDLPDLFTFTPDYIITNPPWDRALLHPMIMTFADIAPTWLLFDADWMHTKQSVPFLPLLRAVVSVGRVKWIPDSKMTGKDNCAWHLFCAGDAGPTVFHGRRT